MANIKKMTLMNKDTPVADIEGEIGTLENLPFPCIVASSVIVTNKKLCPPSIIVSESKKNVSSLFNEWIKKRTISRKRHSLKNLPAVRWDRENPHFLSMSDQYWIRHTENESWKKLNYYDNQYSSIIGLASSSYQLKKVKSLMFPSNCPDLSTNGIQDKMWKRIQGENYLLKWSNQKDQQSILSEVLASKTLGKLHAVPFVRYELYIENYRLCSKCKNFVTPEQEFIPAWHVYQAYSNLFPAKITEDKEIYDILMEAIEYFKIPDMVDFIDNMIIIDRIIMNFDRHLGNFGFLRNVNTGEYIGPAPLFDFGNAFFPDRIDTKKDRYVFGTRAKHLLKMNKAAEPLRKIGDVSNDPIFQIPEFEVHKEIISRNFGLNKRELEKDYAVSRNI